MSTLILFCILVLFLLWLCQDYPTWRRERVDGSSSTENDTPTATATEISSSSPSSSTASTTSNKKEEEDGKRPSFSLAHYILATPLAVVYMVIRLILDALRHAIYYTLWGIEKAAPHVDDWLFDKVTVWIPAKLEQWQQWWDDHGKRYLQAAQHYTKDRLLPALIQGVERTVVALVYGGREAARLWEQMTLAWQRFMQQHDWQQLASDVVDLLTPMALRIAKLAVMIYHGTLRIARSLKQDALWIWTVAIPFIVNKVAASSNTVRRILDSCCIAGIWIMDHMVTPMLRTIQPGMIKMADIILGIVQSPTFIQLRHDCYRAMAVRFVWIVMEIMAMVQDMSYCVEWVVVHTLVPLVSCYFDEIQPRLAQVYHHMVALLVQQILIPIYQRLCPLCITLYTSIAKPIAKVIHQATQYTSKLVSLLGQRAIQITLQGLQHMWPLVSATSQWLQRQAPFLYDLFASIHFKVDWPSLGQDVMEMGRWMVTQAENVLASFERTLSEWIKDQSLPEDDKVKVE
ncbi:hypothetical protein RO3G_02785 [Lichtheimia corymbifera JMRC:FSU:9682]|uniref:Uncharacterized protein n=1 Tax=Lichtheimia corymbifera JMRC:FSU:9682 TaxID=1263082 RepID=A0A068S2L0_9FUNG|nr:hypothetical protein RO3G_02785 [Lichtheimia corymbifera JMRC:FSU:9682]